jgi:hypothetical protein
MDWVVQIGLIELAIGGSVVSFVGVSGGLVAAAIVGPG